jgi:Transglycosylase SLT domain
VIKAAAAVVAGITALPLLVIVLVAASADAPAPTAGSGSFPGEPVTLTGAGIPPDYLAWYVSAARTCPGLPWPVLAGIGKIETDHGRSPLPGVHSGANAAGAEGPMQFLPSTFDQYAVNADPAQPLSPYDPADAIYTAARMLCANGARNGTTTGIEQAIFAYNHADWYVTEVMTWASTYAGQAAGGPDAPSPATAQETSP